MGRDYYFHVIYDKKVSQKELFSFEFNIQKLYCEGDTEVEELLHLGKSVSDVLRPFWNYASFIKEDYDGEFIEIDKNFIIHYLNDKRVEFDYTNFDHVSLLHTLFAVLERMDFNKHTLVFSSC